MQTETNRMLLHSKKGIVDIIFSLHTIYSNYIFDKYYILI